MNFAIIIGLAVVTGTTSMSLSPTFSWEMTRSGVPDMKLKIRYADGSSDVAELRESTFLEGAREAYSGSLANDAEASLAVTGTPSRYEVTIAANKLQGMYRVADGRVESLESPFNRATDRAVKSRQDTGKKIVYELFYTYTSNRQDVVCLLL